MDLEGQVYERRSTLWQQIRVERFKVALERCAVDEAVWVMTSEWEDRSRRVSCRNDRVVLHSRLMKNMKVPLLAE